MTPLRTQRQNSDKRIVYEENKNQITTNKKPILVWLNSDKKIIK